MSTDLLTASGLDAGYGGVQALWDAGLTVRAKETVVLMGPNGAGKTTLIKTIMGLIQSWKGEISFEGRSIAHDRTDKRVRAGIAYMSEIGCFPGLSVEDNLRIGGQFLSAAEFKRHIDDLYARFPTLAQKRRALGGSLSGGQRKILGVAKALAGKPRLLVMDEADRVYTLEGGRIGFEGTVQALHADAALERAYFGLKKS